MGSSLGPALLHCASLCEQTLRPYAESGTAQPPFTTAVVLAIAALQTAAGTDEADPRHEPSLMIAATIARDAAAALRDHGAADEAVLECAAACERTAALCEAAVAPPRREGSGDA